jgi:hypothetical protein
LITQLKSLPMGNMGYLFYLLFALRWVQVLPTKRSCNPLRLFGEVLICRPKHPIRTASLSKKFRHLLVVSLLTVEHFSMRCLPGPQSHGSNGNWCQWNHRLFDYCLQADANTLPVGSLYSTLLLNIYFTSVFPHRCDLSVRCVS